MSNDDKKKIFENISSIKKNSPTFKDIEKNIFKLFHEKYFISNNYYKKIIANSLIYNEKTHIVAQFKEFLVIDDFSEFLKRFYTKKEAFLRLPLFFDYYQTYSKIFPNYTILKESKYIYKNIHRKQKMIDLQQEEESNERKKGLNHQRKKNQQEISTIFDNDVYNSIIKQSQDLYMILFGIKKSAKNLIDSSKNEEDKNSFSSFDINNIVKLIEKYDYESKIGFNYKNNLIIPKIYKNINSKKYIKKENNSSLLSKQSTHNSSNAHQKIKNFKNNDDIIIGLKKIRNEKKQFNSNSLLMSQKLNKNSFSKFQLKTLKSGQFFNNNLLENSKSKSKSKEIKKLNKIKVNQKILIDNKNNYLTDRALISRYKNLNFDSFNNSNINRKMKSKYLNKKLTEYNYYSKIKNLNINSNIYKHSRINTNTNINNITELSKHKFYKTKLLNRSKAKNFIECNNKLKININKMRELIKSNKIPDNKCYTERSSINNTSQKYKDKKIDVLQQNKLIENIKYNLINKINNHKKSVPSLEFKTKINKKLLLSQRLIGSSKANKYNLKSNFLPLPFKESFKINKNIINQICNRKITSNIDKIEDRNFYSERGPIQYAKKICPEKMKLNTANDSSILKHIKFTCHNTATNSKNKDIKRNIKKGQYVNIKKNLHIKRIHKINKQIKRKEISPIDSNNAKIFNNSERNKNYLNVNKLLNKIK